MPTVNTMQTGANIKTMMKNRNMKVIDIQTRFGFNTPQAIFKWFRGDTVPTIDNLIILADIFGVTINDIVAINK